MANDIIRPMPSRKPPVKAVLERVDASISRVMPGDVPVAEWRKRLRATLATASDEFVDATLIQLQSAARLPNSGVSELAVNAALAFIDGAQPRSEPECALVVQMACTHTAAMAVLGRLGGGHGGDRHVTAMATAASRLLRSYSSQMEALRRLRVGATQTIRIERVEVKEGGQAVIGIVGGKDRDG